MFNENDKNFYIGLKKNLYRFIGKIVRCMKVDKACLLKDVPIEITKMSANTCANFICLHFTHYCHPYGGQR